MKLRYLLFILLCTVSVFSQDKLIFNLELKQVYESSLNRSVIVGNNVSLNNEFLPEFGYTLDISSDQSLKDYKFINLVVKELTREEVKAVDSELLSEGFNPSARIVKRNNQNVLTLYSNVVYKASNNSFFKVISFDFEYNLKAVSSARVSQTNTSNIQINSVLSTGTWYKIAIDKTGVFKMDKSFLNSIGVNTSSLDPMKIRVYGNGGALLPELLRETRKEDLVENAIFVSGENDNVFNEDDYVLFFGQGPMSWKLNSRTDISHVQNIYDEFAYYFINVDSGVNGKRIQNKAIVNQGTTININTFTDYLVHEEELINYTRVGREWFGEDFDEDNFQTFGFNFPDIDVTVPVTVNGVFSANSSTSTTYTVSDNNSNQILSATIAGVRTISGLVNSFEQGEDKNDFTATNGNIELDVFWNNNGNASAEAHLNYLEVIADRFLINRGDSFLFTNFNSNLNSEVLEYTISEVSELDMVWNVTDHTNIENILDTDVNSSVFKFKEITDGSLDTYYTVNASDTYSPIRLASSSNVKNQNLHSLSNIQYLIITTNGLKSQAERLANYHRLNTKISDSNTTLLNVSVVDVEDIYNEFGSGSSDITAIRDFVKYIYDQDPSNETRLKYLCLFGDTSFDYKGIIYPGTNIIPTYESSQSQNLHQSYASDDYYGYLDASDDINDNNDLDSTGQLDISTGRIPVKTVAEAKQFVDKALNYYSVNSFGVWKNKISLLGDDGQDGDDQNLIEHLDTSAKIIEANKPSLNLQKLYTDAFSEVISSGGGSYPDIKKRFDEAFNTGALVINYFGHGNVSSLGEENYLDISDIRSYKNFDNLPLFITVTCDFSRLDDPIFVSGGEELMISVNGGAASMITTAREITVNAGRDINSKLADYLYSFDGQSRTIAEALKDVKNQLTNSSERFVFFFGDPAMKLSFPEENIVIDKITKEIKDTTTGSVSFSEVTELNGLSKLRVTGEVQENGVLNTNFSGNLSILLYEKEIDRKTLLNEAGGVTALNQSSVVEFKSLENIVFRGEASVVNGNFTFDFILPKDVNAIPDNAKFSFYAFSDEKENVGSNFQFTVGGIDPDVEEDTTPPVIQLFFEDESFIDGERTSLTPVLLAKISDESGINTSLNAIGHDISLVIDGDLLNPISLNEFYTTEADDFTNGIVSFELPELEVGNHTVTFTAWDTHNNSSTQTLSFYAEEDTGFEISDVLNYPNPFINHTEFWFNHNRRRDSFDIKIQIYTVSGKLIKTVKSFATDNSGTIRQGNAPTWDGKDDFGNRLGKGVYLYKLVVKDLITGEVDEKVEKLVIL